MKKILYTCLVAFTLISCQKDDEISPDINTVQVKVTADPNEIGYQIAKSLSSAVKSREVREFIKEQASQKFDGDYDILIAKTQHEKLTLPNGRGSLSFGEILFENNTTQITQNSSTNNIFKENPLLQISVPELPSGITAEDWDVENHSPIIVYRAPGLDLSKVTHLPAFNSDGESIDFDITKIPSSPIIIVSFNERLTAIPKNNNTVLSLDNLRTTTNSMIEPYYQDEHYDYYLTNQLYDTVLMDSGDGGGGGYSGGTGTSTSCDRDIKTTNDHLKKVRFTSMEYFRAAESYIDGNPEIYFVITFGAKDPGGFSNLRKYIPSIDRSHWKDCGVFTCNPEWYGDGRNGMPLSLFNWDKEFYGDRVRYDWFEEDFSKVKVEYTAGLTVNFKQDDRDTNVSGSVKFIINDTDKILGQDVVRYCDNTDGDGTLYTTGQLEWYVNQQ